MSHGRDHDARGVKGTHLKGTVPTSSVLNSIPPALGAVGNIPEQVRPGDQAITAERVAQYIQTKKLRHDEGIPVLPGGNRDTSLAAPRPEAKTATPDQVVEQVPAKLEEPVRKPAAITEPAVEPVPEPVAVAPEPVVILESGEEDELEEEGPALPTSKRRLIRAKVDELRSWCSMLELVPEEYVESDDQVNGDLMRVLVGDKLGISHGIVLPEE